MTACALIVAYLNEFEIKIDRDTFQVPWFVWISMTVDITFALVRALADLLHFIVVLLT
jgi:hypothetical protein